ncbi:MAG TPA: hypothetical protein VKU00_14440 [Chthonomonadaceae bacterium]|nr:hypothetical protein [Chthonomonadaceae bacterium]
MLLSRGASPDSRTNTIPQSQHTRRIVQTIARHQEAMALRTSLRDVPNQFLQMLSAPYFTEYIGKVRSLCPPGGKTCEIGRRSEARASPSPI